MKRISFLSFVFFAFLTPNLSAAVILANQFAGYLPNLQNLQLQYDAQQLDQNILDFLKNNITVDVRPVKVDPNCKISYPEIGLQFKDQRLSPRGIKITLQQVGREKQSKFIGSVSAIRLTDFKVDDLPIDVAIPLIGFEHRFSNPIERLEADEVIKLIKSGKCAGKTIDPIVARLIGFRGSEIMGVTVKTPRVDDDLNSLSSLSVDLKIHLDPPITPSLVEVRLQKTGTGQNSNARSSHKGQVIFRNLGLSDFPLVVTVPAFHYRKQLYRPEAPGKKALLETFFSAQEDMKNQNWDAAISTYTKILNVEPDQADSYLNRGLAYYVLGDLGRAEKDYIKALEKRPTFAAAHYNRGGLWWNMQEYDKAEEAFRKAAELNPDSARYQLQLGFALIKLKRSDEALQSFSRAIQIKPDYARAYYHRGGVYLEKNNLKAAIIDWTRVIELGGELTAGAYFYRGNAYWFSGQRVAGLADLNSACRMNYPKACENYKEYFFNQ